MPRRRASSTRLKRSTLPPPDLGFMSRTGRAAGPTAVPGVGLLLSDLRSRPSAYLAATPAIATSAITPISCSSWP